MTKSQLEKILGIKLEDGKDAYTDDEVTELVAKSYSELRSDLTKNKDLLSKRNSEIAEYKRKEQEKLTDDEKARLQFEETVKENNALKRKILRSEKIADYIGLGYSKELAEKVADAELDGKSTVELRKQFIVAKEESIKAELLKETPNPDTKKDTSTKTKEEIVKGGYEEMLKLKETNPEVYNEYFGKAKEN
jgi:hypothetical protein